MPPSASFELAQAAFSADRRKALAELDVERKACVELRGLLSKLGRTLGLGAFDEENAPSFGKRAEAKIRGARRENEILRQELAEFIDSSVLRVTKAMYRETLYAKGWKADQID